MKLRKAKAEDAEGIANVLLQSYNINSVEEGLKAFETESNKEVRYLVAEDNGKIVGLVTWLPHGLPKHELIELDRIAVLPECRGKAVSHELFRFLIKDAKRYFRGFDLKLRKLYALTHASNTPAHKFYEKMGMKKEAVIPSHFYAHEDEWVYAIYP